MLGKKFPKINKIYRTSLNLVIILHNIRSCYNVGSIIRSAEAMGVQSLYFSGYTPYPKLLKDDRLPHLADKINHQIIKTSLGAEKNINWQVNSDVNTIIDKLRGDGYLIAALEQSADSQELTYFKHNKPLALIVGQEVGGLPDWILRQCQVVLEIPMYGKKESLNVSVATAIAIYRLTT